LLLHDYPWYPAHYLCTSLTTSVGARCVLRLTIRLENGPGDDGAQAALGAISMLFELPMLQCSRVVRHG